ncbi:MAG TPA: alpha/beta family hydrolase [Kofleriaceae bacterium]
MAEEVQLADQTCLYERPRGAKALYVFAHGAGAGMRHEFMEAVSRQLASHQIATLRYEFPYMRAGRARTDKPEICEATVIEIFNAAKRFKLPRFAGGKSFGGRMTSRAHAALPLADLRGLIFLGWPLHPPDKPGIARAEHLPRAAGPMLFLTGTRDPFAQLDLWKPVVASLGDRAELALFEGSDHGFTRPKGVVEKLGAAIAAWVYSR